MCEPYLVLYSLQGPKSNGSLGRKDKSDPSKGERQEMNRCQESSVSAGPQAIYSAKHSAVMLVRVRFYMVLAMYPPFCLMSTCPRVRSKWEGKDPLTSANLSSPIPPPNENAPPHVVILVSQMTDFSGNT